MSQGTLLLLSTVLVLLSVTIAVVAWVSSIRWTREYREAIDRTAGARDQEIQARDDQLRGKDEALRALRDEVALLKEMDSVRFADRYLETKAGLEQRLHRLETRRDRWKARLEDEQRKRAELELSSEEKAAELQRLRSELTKTQLDSRTIEDALQAVSTMGEIPVEDLRSALQRRRRRQTEITARLEKLSLEGEGKASEIERLEGEIERARKEVDLVEREIEITRAAGPILDSLLGVTADMRDRLAAVEERLDRSMRSLSRAPGRDPIAEFLDAAAGATRERNLLLAAGRSPGAEKETRISDLAIRAQEAIPETSEGRVAEQREGGPASEEGPAEPDESQAPDSAASKPEETRGRNPVSRAPREAEAESPSGSEPSEEEEDGPVEARVIREAVGASARPPAEPGAIDELRRQQ